MWIYCKGKRKDTGASTSTIPNGYACGGPAAQVEWLSLDVVKTALHVPVEANFFQCDNGDDFLYNLTETDLISWYKEIIATNSLRILVYNGDTDPCINAYQAQNWTRNLGTVLSPLPHFDIFMLFVHTIVAIITNNIPGYWSG